MTNPTMPAIVIEDELGKTIKINPATGPREPGRYDVNTDGVTILADADGVLSAPAATITDTLEEGVVIGTVTNADGTVATLKQSLTKLTITDAVLTFLDENGDPNELALPGPQVLSMTPEGVLSLSGDGGSVDVKEILLPIKLTNLDGSIKFSVGE